MCRIPTTSSVARSQTGRRVWPLSDASCTASSQGAASGIEIILVRVVMICDTRTSLRSITPSIISRALPPSLPSRCASSTTSRSSSWTFCGEAPWPRRPNALPRTDAAPPSIRTAGESTSTSGCQRIQVATTIHGPANFVTSIGTTTSTSHTMPIQPATAENSSTDDLFGMARSPREAKSVATTAVTTTIVAAINAIASLPATISS